MNETDTYIKTYALLTIKQMSRLISMHLYAVVTRAKLDSMIPYSHHKIFPELQTCYYV